MTVEKNAGAGVGVILKKGNKILMGKRIAESNKKTNSYESWTVPGGRVEYKESLEDAVKRETFEEVGIKVKNLEFISAANCIYGEAHFLTVCFVTEDFEGEPKEMEPHKIINWTWFDLDDLPENIFEPTRVSIENYKNKRFYKSNY